MEEQLQASLGRRFTFNLPTVVIGKVIRLHQGNGCTIDVALMNGGFVRDAPVLFASASTISGLSHLVAPTVDPDNPTRPTYGSSNSNMAQAPAATDGANRDIYAALIQCEGYLIGTSGWLVLGFMYSTDGEMMFPADSLLSQLGDLFLYRHPSDFQVTIDKYGTTSLQHSAGARIAIGDRHALDESVVKDKFLDLTGKDQNGKYKLRANTDKHPVIVSELVGLSKVLQDSDGSVELSNAAGASAVLGEDGSIDFQDAFGNEITMGPDGIKLKSKGLIGIDAQDQQIDLQALAFHTTLSTVFELYNHHLHPGVTPGKGSTLEVPEAMQVGGHP